MTNTNQAVSQQKNLKKAADELLKKLNFKPFSCIEQKLFEQKMKKIPIIA